MTAPDPRLGAYHPANQQAATDDLIRMLTDSADIPGSVRLPREAVNMLLAELRKAQDALGRVEAIEQRLERSMQGEDREIAEDIRAAVADATGGEDAQD